MNIGLTDNPFVYDVVQVLAGRHIVDRHLSRAMADAGNEAVLDVGAGTGSLARLRPADAVYWALDNDPAKLRRLSVKVPYAHCLEGSALDIGLPDRAVDWTVCVAVTHHLNDEELPRLFAELARVTRRQLVFLDALWTATRGISRLLWRYDRGSYPRSADTLLSAMSTHLDVERVERFSVFHEYVLCSARPIREQ